MADRRVNAHQLARLLAGAPAGRPAYTALAAGVRTLVQDGRLTVATRLPAERELATALGVSRTTVTAAYDALRAEGFVASRRGAGSWTALPPARVRPPRGAAPLPATAGDVIDLGCAAPGAPACFDAAVAAAVAELPRYTHGPGYDPAGLPVLRAAIAARYTARGVATRPEQILVTSGAQQALALLVDVLVEPGTPVLTERPAYQHAFGALRRRGARIVPVGVAAGWDVELIAASLRQSAVRAAYLIPDFQNPTGHLMSARDRAALVAAANRTDTLLISDESFAEIALDPDAPLPAPLAAHGPSGRVISVGSASKLLWGGLRIGWIRAGVSLVERLARARVTVDIASPVLDQLITAELLARVTEIRAERAALLRPRRDALVAALHDRLPGWEFTSPAGGMSLWARLGSPVAAALAEAAERRGVWIMPGPDYGVDGVLEDCVRLPYVLPPDTLRAAVDRLADAAAEVASAPAVRPRPVRV
ncbi:PLP-dependent aminotransferase family protein [Actinomadura flavalba]|uniref:MocR-like transcription factor YczR n=1 Tax=Actinomadura flavalba TaxID=1120938 RepID=UPI0003A52418|nr:PLP-dependent aminotransferase family protein [Actinomadura flavalba]